MTAREDALSLAAQLNPGILARALECEKSPVKALQDAGKTYRRQLGEVADVIEPVLHERDARVVKILEEGFPS